MGKSKIDWTEHTWDVTGGCNKYATGCADCWALRSVWRLAHHPMCGERYKGLVEKTKSGLQWTGKIKLFDDMLEVPLKRKKPTRYFVDSKADLFHELVPDWLIGDVFETIRKTPRHIYYILSKRVERMADVAKVLIKGHGQGYFNHVFWITSISTQADADKNIPIALQIPGKKGLSIEPMIEGIDLWDAHYQYPDNSLGSAFGWGNGVNWIVVGGESGPKARPLHPDWVRSIRDQCQAAGVPFYFKQWGAWMPVFPMEDNFPSCGNAPEGNYKTHDWDDYSYSLSVGKKKAGHLLDGKEYREYPK